MSTWNTSNYRQRKAQRQTTRPAHWVTNPETQESFFIRPQGAAAMVLAGYLPSALTEAAVEGWKQHGIEAPSDENSNVSTATVKSSEETERVSRTSARLVYEACLIPTLTAIGEEPASIQERALRNCELAFVEDESWKSANERQKLERAAEVVLPLEELDESDVMFILSRSHGYVGNVPMQGGQVMNVTDLKSVRQKAGRRSRTGTNG